MVQLAETLSDNFEQDGHKVYRLQLGAGLAGILPFPYLYFYFFWIILQYDIIHIISASGNALWLKDLVAIIIARLFRKKVILHFVGGMAIDHFSEWPLHKRIPFRWSNNVVVPTTVLKDLIEKNEIGSKISVIPNVVNIEPFHRISKEVKGKCPVLLAAKALEPYAGFDLLLDIFLIVKKKIPDIQLWIAGSGTIEEDLKIKVKSSNIEDVIFFGNISHDEMPDIMRKSTIFIHGSQYESFGIVLVEAMAAGLPVVAFGVGGIPDVVIESEMGFLVPYGDKDIFSNKVIILLKDKNMRKQMAERAREHSIRFGWGNISKSWYQLYSNT